MKDSLGDRIKNNYESRQQYYLTRRIPVIIRLDGRAFHNYTKGLNDKFNANLIECMNLTAVELMNQIQGAQIAYIQSDEISILVHDYKRLVSDAWFDYNKSKVESISAAIASATFTTNSYKIWENDSSANSIQAIKPAYFDSRSFNIPEAEVCNYFIWRQKDAERNSINTLGQINFTHKELQHKTCLEVKQMLENINIFWEKTPTSVKRGRSVIKVSFLDSNKPSIVRSKLVIDDEIPIFTEDRNYIERYLVTE